MISNLHECQCPKAILTVYPKAFDPEAKVIRQDDVPVAMCFKEFAKSDGLPRFKSRSLLPGKLTRPFRSLFWAAGFSFSKGSLLEECAYTMEVDDVFFGEELFQMMKFHDKGWTLFSPAENLIYHLWERDYRPTFAAESKTKNKARQEACMALIKERVLGNLSFIEEMRRRGVDLVTGTATTYA